MLSNEHYICKNLNEYSTTSNPSCKSQLLTKEIRTLPSDCQIRLLYGDFEIWQKLNNNRWIYIYSKPTKLTVNCISESVKEIELFHTGIIELNKGCKAYANLIQLTTTDNLETNWSAPAIAFDLSSDDCCNKNKINLTKETLIPIKLNNIQLYDLNLAYVKLESLNDKITNNLNI